MEAPIVSMPIDEVTDNKVIQEIFRTESHPPVKKPVESEQKTSIPKVQHSEELAEDIAEKMNKVASVFNTSLSFSVDKATGKPIIKVLDKETKEVVRQIPPEEMLRMIGKMRYVMGMLLDIEM